MKMAAALLAAASPTMAACSGGGPNPRGGQADVIDNRAPAAPATTAPGSD